MLPNLLINFNIRNIIFIQPNFIIDSNPLFNWHKSWAENVAICHVSNLSVSTAKKNSKIKSFFTTIKKLNTFTVPNAPKNSHPSIQWSNTQELIIMLMSKEYQMPIQAKTISDWKFSVCKESPDLKSKIGFPRVWEDTGEEFWKESRRKDWSYNSRKWNKKRKKESKEMNILKTITMEWRLRRMKSLNKIWTFHSSSAFLKIDSSCILLVIYLYAKCFYWYDNQI